MARIVLWLIKILRLENIDRFIWKWRYQRRQLLLSFLAWLSMLGTVFGLLVGVGVLGIVWRMNTDLPSYEHLANYEPSVMTRIYAADGALLGEYAKQQRLFVPYQEVPPQLVNALIATEDKSYWTHPGVDIQGIARAAVMNVSRFFKGQRLAGGSTITQQVARNFLLTQKVRLERKIKEALLALRIERVLSKEKIMELYVNQIYLGLATHGVAAAALRYFGKALNELTLAEVAYIAALPKGPNNYHPVRKKPAALARRNWVLKRMYEEGYITKAQRKSATAQPIYPPPPRLVTDKRWDYFTEDVRRSLKSFFGDKPLYSGGLTVRATLNTEMQRAAYNALRNGLSAYDRRHGYRGPIRKLPQASHWPTILSKMTPPKDIDPWHLAVVLQVGKRGAKIGLRPSPASANQAKQSGSSLLKTQVGFIPLNEMKWAREQYADNSLGAQIKHPKQVLEKGDIVYVEPLLERPRRDPMKGVSLYSLRQLPQVNGGIVVLNPHNGKILAMTGGFSFAISEFNRATQAWRQPGSAVKPFVYAGALDSGFTPISKVLDAPFVGDRGNQYLWKPENYSDKFNGPSLLRDGLEFSRNLMTVHLTNEIGLGIVIDYLKRFGIATDIRPEFSLALGVEETTLLRLTAGYAMLANGGKHVKPYAIERIQDRLGRTVYRHDKRQCRNCLVKDGWRGEPPPELPDTRAQVISQQTIYQVVSMLQGVVKRGTGVRAKVKGLNIAGKTGTTNKERDAWFVGFTPDLVAGVYVGFDTPKPMGKRETGGQVAAPIFRDFMEQVKPLLGKAKPFPMPAGITLVRIDRKTGKPATNNSENTIWEAFKSGTEPGSNNNRTVNRRDPAYDSESESGDFSGTGGLY